MALFGAPIAHEDHAQRACYAALALQDDLRRYANELRLEKGISFAVRMGINSGEVVVGKIGDDLRMDYTALGHTASLAARMEQIAAPDRAYVTLHTARLVHGLFVVQDLGPHAVKGAKEPIRVFELQAAGRLKMRLEVARTRGFSRFVGREAEMHVLETALERAIAGQGQVVGVVGEPGVGKSRLCLEFVEGCRARGVLVNEGHCPHGKVLPFVPILELWRSYFRILETDSPEEARRKIAGTLLLLGEEFREVHPVVFEFLGVRDADHPAPPVDGLARQRQLFGFLRRLTEVQSAREPSVVLIDDLHWIDAASDAFVALRKSHYQQLALLPLGRDATDALLDDLLGVGTAPSRNFGRRSPSGPEAIRFSSRRSFKGSSKRERWREQRERSGSLTRSSRWRSPRPSRWCSLPGSIGFATRKSASSGSRRSWAGSYPQKGSGAWRMFPKMRLGRRSRSSPNPSFSVRQRSIHFEQAGEGLDAGRWHGRAAEWTEKNDLEQALEHWRKVRRLVSGLSESPEVVALGLLGCRKILSIGWHLGLSEEEAASVFATGRPLAERARDLRSLAILLATYGALQSAAGACDEFVDKSLEAMRVASQIGDLDLQATVATFVQIAHVFAGRVCEGLAFSESALRDGLAGRVVGRDVAGYDADVCFAFTRGYFLMMAGAAHQGLLEIDRAERLAVEHDDRLYLSIVNYARSWCAAITGNDLSVLLRARRGLEISESLGYAHGIFYGLEAVGVGHALRGEWTDARTALDRALAFAHEHRIARPLEPRMVAYVARVALRLGEIERSRSIIATAIRSAKESHARLGELRAHLEHSRIVREVDGANGIDDATASLAAAERLIEETGAESFWPQLREERGRLAELSGDRAMRDRELAEAHRLYIAIGADGHAARLAKEIAAQ